MQYRRIVTTLAALAVASPSLSLAQRDTVRAPSGIGVYFGLIYEASRLDGGPARVLEGESGRVGVMLGRWSAGYVGKTIRAGSSVRVVRPGDIMANLHVQGAEVGYLVTNRWWWIQPVLFVTVGRGEVVAYQNSSSPPYPAPERAARTVIEPSVGVGVPLGPIFRLDGRAGMRVGGDVRIGTEEYSLGGAVASLTVSLGWMTPWRAGR